MDDTDKDIFETAQRETMEEAGVRIKNMEILCKTGSTSSGMSDETNAILLAEIDGEGHSSLETFEDIDAKIYSYEETERMLKDERCFFSDIARILLLYMMERFSH